MLPALLAGAAMASQELTLVLAPGCRPPPLCWPNPKNYPPGVAEAKLKGHHHQTEEVAWGFLGTAQRMESLKKLMDQAQELTKTPEQKHRVALFKLGVWDYMTVGRQKHTAKSNNRGRRHIACRSHFT
jgi:hypothetical protein